MRVIDVLKENKWRAALGFTAKIVEAILELLVPLVVADIINNGINQNDTNYILTRGALLIALPLLGYLFAFVCQWHASVVSQRVGTRLRELLFEKMNDMDYAQTDEIGAASITTRITNDTHNIQQMVAMGIRLVSRSPVLLIGSIAMAYIVSPQLSSIFIVSGILLGIILSTITIMANHRYGIIQKWLDKLSRIVRENLNGIRDIRAFANQESEISRFNDGNAYVEKEQIITGRIQALANPASLFIVNIAIGFILYFGARLVNNGFFMQGEVVALVNYMNSILLALNVLVQVILLVSKGIAGIKRVDQILTVEPTLLQAEEIETRRTEAAVGEKGLSIEFQDVSFGYGVKNTLEKIDFTIDSGSFFGIIGGTASGKTTLINLIPRLYDLRSGEILVGGRPIKEWPLEELRSHIAIVPQTASLFTGTIRQNLKLGNQEATDEELWEALEVAQAADFVRSAEDGLDAGVSQGGKNFSGGQKQRLSIARAIARKSGILILDDSVSALDFSTEAKLRRALRSLDTTVVMVSQRISSIRHSDQIVVLQYGRVDGAGTHEELLEESEVYQAIASSQEAEGVVESA